jgi:hypothetical protein
MPTPKPDKPDVPLLAWPWRVLVFAALAVLALLAIGVMDRHAMQHVPHAAQARTALPLPSTTNPLVE